MSLTTITVNSSDYTSYASLGEANALLAVNPVRSDAWSDLSNNEKGFA